MSNSLVALISVIVVCGIVALFLVIFGLLAKKHVVFDFKGHKIEILTRMLGAKFIVDGVVVDEGSRYIYSYHFDFVKKIENDTIKVYVARKFMTPEIKVFVNDEKFNINY